MAYELSEKHSEFEPRPLLESPGVQHRDIRGDADELSRRVLTSHSKTRKGLFVPLEISNHARAGVTESRSERGRFDMDDRSTMCVFVLLPSKASYDRR